MTVINHVLGANIMLASMVAHSPDQPAFGGTSEPVQPPDMPASLIRDVTSESKLDQQAGEAVEEAMSEAEGLGHNSSAIDAGRKALKKAARQLGLAEVNGADALPNLFVLVVRAAKDGFIKPNPKGKAAGGKKGDVAEIFDAYVDQRAKANFLRAPASKAAQISKLNAGAKAGVMTNVDFVTVLNKAVKLHQDATKIDPKKFKPAYDAFVSVARAQYGSETDLGDAEIETEMLRPAPKTKEAKKILEALVAQCDHLILGDKGVQVTAGSGLEEVTNARDWLTKAVATLTLQDDRREMLAKLDALGIQVVRTEQELHELDGLTITVEDDE